MFAIRFECREAKDGLNKIVTHEGRKVWVHDDEWCFTSSWFMDECLKIFETEEAAHKFMSTWKGHPWYHLPNGNYEVVRVEPVYKQVLTGYEVCTP